MAPSLRTLVSILTLALSFASLTSSVEGKSTPVLSVWPQPKDATFGKGQAVVLPSCSIFHVQAKVVPRIVHLGILRYCRLLFPHVGAVNKTATLRQVNIAFHNADESHPQLGLDESYYLKISEKSVDISAETVFGVLHALESFSQLVSFDFDAKQYVVDNVPWEIKDEPRFPHRGLMIDTSRHFLSLTAIRKLVRSLPYSKVNVLHWHMVDSQSFPFESKTHPKLWEGAFSPQERYTQEDVASIVKYARLRGVRVMVEFDVPGHAKSWCAGYPEICPSTTCFEPLNVANPKTFDLLEDLLGECTGKKSSEKGMPSGLFPDNMIHLGGDEVNTNCWKSTESVSNWLQAKNMSPHDGYLYFVKRAGEIAIKQGRRPIHWDEVWQNFKTKLHKQTIIHIWNNGINLTEIAAAGYNILQSDSRGGHDWYLDHLSVRWADVYTFEPCNGMPLELCHMVLGGQGEMWGETVDVSDLEQTVWPRMAAIAERLWSPRNVINVEEAEPRIASFRCLLNRRGIEAAPISVNGRGAPPHPESCFKQRR